MTRPTATCVRCGNHASVCMSWVMEFLAEESLNFYRKTLLEIVMSLFANAITQTGVTKVVKYVIFMMWRNSFRERKWMAKKKEFMGMSYFASTSYVPVSWDGSRRLWAM